MKVKWKCKDCGEILISNKLEHHKMDNCKCGKSSLDAEKEYIRILGSAEIISED